MRKYKAKQITNKEHKAYGKWGVTFKVKGSEYCVQYGDSILAYDTKEEAEEKALIERYLDHRAEMDKISEILRKEYGYTEERGEKCVGDLLA